MKKLISILLCVWFLQALLFKNTSQAKDKTILGIVAERNEASDLIANLAEGNFEIDGSLALHNTFSTGDDYTHLLLSFGSEYFVANRLSLGGQLYHYSTRGYNEFGLGPSGKYYFFQKDRFAPFLGLAFLYNDSNDVDYYFTSKTTFGFKYFVTPTVAVMSGLSWFHLFGRNQLNSYSTLNRVSIEMGFAIHL